VKEEFCRFIEEMPAVVKMPPYPVGNKLEKEKFEKEAITF
jgi:hypothetical protein